MTMTEKEQAFLNYQENQKKQYKRGKLLVCFIAGSAIASSLFSLLSNFNFQQLVLSAISIVLATLLLYGYNWARNLYASIASVNVILGLAATMVWFDTGESTLQTKVLFYGAWVFFIAVNAAIAVLLFCSKAVKEYMYQKRNG